MRAFVCAAIAQLLSLQLFSLLLEPAAGGQQHEALPAIVVAIVPAAEMRSLDAAQPGKPNLTAAIDQNSNGDSFAAAGGRRPFAGYLPASLLSERPQVLQDIDPDWHFDGLSLPAVECVLLINEYGDVDRVLISGSALSPMLAEDVRARFLAARFSPGRLHGRTVKSALRIEVRLD